jgi:polyhydroxyalkanoate synthase
VAGHLTQRDSVSEGAGAADDDPRFRHEAWAQWPFSQMRAGFRNAEAFWREASRVPGMTAHHANMTEFFARQWLGVMAPANWLATNPVVLRDAIESGGAHLAQGARHWLADVTGVAEPDQGATEAKYVVGRDVAVTPGAVVYRNHLIELIRYDPQTPQVHPEPVLVIVPSWIMKYYILDLSPHNSMVRYLVSQGHTVYMLSWRNPDASDAELTLDDYLRWAYSTRCRRSASTAAPARRCMPWATAWAARCWPSPPPPSGRKGGVRGARALPPLASPDAAGRADRLLRARRAGPVHRRKPGRLSGPHHARSRLPVRQQMAGSFQFLHSRDLVWTRRMREYLMGEREQPNDLMAWNADTTRMPARMHHEYLTSLYLHNALATSTTGWRAARCRWVTFASRCSWSAPSGTTSRPGARSTSCTTCATPRSPSRCAVAATTPASSPSPGHANRRYRMATRPAHGDWVEADEWARNATPCEGSWWTAWQAWLAARSGPRQPARRTARAARLSEAPGTYVLQRYAET